jgi:hypothetical protein
VAIRIAYAAAVRPERSRLRGGLRVGLDFFARRGALASPATRAPRGIVDRMSDYAHPGMDTSRIHPAIARFFEDTGSLALHVESHWRFPASLGWWLFRGVMRAVGQFVLPWKSADIVTRVFAIDTAVDGRDDARAVVRTYEGTGEIMQVVSYATWRRGDTGYMSAAFPLPGGHVAGILRLDANGEDDEGRLAVALTSSARGDDAGVWLVLGPVALPALLDERLELWATGTKTAPREIDEGAWPDATIVGRHEQRLLGVRFVTHHYWFSPLEPSRTDNSPEDDARERT